MIDTGWLRIFKHFARCDGNISKPSFSGPNEFETNHTTMDPDGGGGSTSTEFLVTHSLKTRLRSGTTGKESWKRQFSGERQAIMMIMIMKSLIIRQCFLVSLRALDLLIRICSVWKQMRSNNLSNIVTRTRKRWITDTAQYRTVPRYPWYEVVSMKENEAPNI